MLAWIVGQMQPGSFVITFIIVLAYTLGAGFAKIFWALNASSMISALFVLLAAQGKLPLTDAIPVASNDRAEERWRDEIAVQRVKAGDDITKLAGAVGNLEGNNDPAIGHDSRFGALRVGECIELDSFARCCLTPGFAGEFPGQSGLLRGRWRTATDSQYRGEYRQ